MRISISIFFITLIFNTLLAQNNDIHTIYTSVDGTQSSMLFKNTGSLFSLNDKDTYRIQKEENGVLKLAFSFDNVNALFVGKYTFKPKVMPTIWSDNKKAAVTFGFDNGMTNANVL